MSLLENKTILITGATRGIGKGIARVLSKNGANIAFTYNNIIYTSNNVYHFHINNTFHFTIINNTQDQHSQHYYYINICFYNSNVHTHN